jgi:hypothetical protein
MAWTGVVLASLDPMSLSGAPRRAMPPVGSRAAAAMRRDGRRREERRRIEVADSHPDGVKGNDAWREHPGTRRHALDRAMRGPSQSFWCAGLACEEEGTNKEDSQQLGRRSDKVRLS